MTDGIVRFSPALFGKLAQTPRNYGMEGVAQSTRYLSELADRMSARRQARDLMHTRLKAEQTRFETEQAGLERRHGEDITSREKIAHEEEAGRMERADIEETGRADRTRAEEFGRALRAAAEAKDRRDRLEQDKKEAEDLARHRAKERFLSVRGQELDAERNEIARQRLAFDVESEKPKTGIKALDRLYKRRNDLSDTWRKHAVSMAKFREGLHLDDPKHPDYPKDKRRWVAEQLRTATELQQNFPDLSDDEVEDAVESMVEQGRTLRPKDEWTKMLEAIFSGSGEAGAGKKPPAARSNVPQTAPGAAGQPPPPINLLGPR